MHPIGAQTITLNGPGDPITISNVYFPPRTSCTTNQAASTVPLLSPTLLLEAFNVQRPRLNSELDTEPRGEPLADEITHSDVIPLNTHTQTQLI